MSTSCEALSGAETELEAVNTALSSIASKVYDTFEIVNVLMGNMNQMSEKKEVTIESLDSISKVVMDSASTSEEISANLLSQEELVEMISEKTKTISSVGDDLNAVVKEFSL